MNICIVPWRVKPIYQIYISLHSTLYCEPWPVVALLGIEYSGKRDRENGLASKHVGQILELLLFFLSVSQLDPQLCCSMYVIMDNTTLILYSIQDICTLSSIVVYPG